MSSANMAARVAVGKVPLLVGFLAGPIVWSLHELLGLILISSACSYGVDGFRHFVVAGTAGWQIVILIETLIFALLLLGADIIAFRAWRRSGVGMDVTGAIGGPTGRSGWMALSGILLSTFFLIGIIAAGITLFWLSGCS